MEIWKPIKEYEGLYEISNYGNVRSLDKQINAKNGSLRTIKGKLLKAKIDKDGYLLIGLTKDNIQKYFRIHRLVALTFIDNPNNLPLVNHIDENKQNNAVDNLEWCTTKYNNTYGSRMDNVTEKLSLMVGQYDKGGTLIATYNSTQEAGRAGFSQSCISRCCNGESKTHKGFIWRYIN